MRYTRKDQQTQFQTRRLANLLRRSRLVQKLRLSDVAERAGTHSISYIHATEMGRIAVSHHKAIELAGVLGIPTHIALAAWVTDLLGTQMVARVAAEILLDLETRQDEHGRTIKGRLA